MEARWCEVYCARGNIPGEGTMLDCCTCVPVPIVCLGQCVVGTLLLLPLSLLLPIDIGVCSLAASDTGRQWADMVDVTVLGVVSAGVGKRSHGRGVRWWCRAAVCRALH